MQSSNLKLGKLKKRKKILKKLTLKGNKSNTPDNNSFIKSDKNQKKLESPTKPQGDNPYLNPALTEKISYREIIKSQGKEGAFFNYSIPKEPIPIPVKENPKQRKKLLKINLKTIPEKQDQHEHQGLQMRPSRRLFREKQELVPLTTESQVQINSKKSISTNAKSTLKGMSNRLRPKAMRFEERPTEKDIREIIETSHDVGREIENLVQPIDEQKAAKICENESLKYFLGKQSFCKVYFGVELLKKTGEGIYLFFLFLMLCSIVFFIYALLNLGPLVLNVKGNYEEPEDKFNLFTKMSYGNLKKQKHTNYEKTKDFLSSYFDKIQEEFIEEEQGGTTVVIKHSSSNI
jgi:hypothetical protein